MSRANPADGVRRKIGLLFLIGCLCLVLVVRWGVSGYYRIEMEKERQKEAQEMLANLEASAGDWIAKRVHDQTNGSLFVASMRIARKKPIFEGTGAQCLDLSLKLRSNLPSGRKVNVITTGVGWNFIAHEGTLGKPWPSARVETLDSQGELEVLSTWNAVPIDGKLEFLPGGDPVDKRSEPALTD